jgi:hypothetical protein
MLPPFDTRVVATICGVTLVVVVVVVVVVIYELSSPKNGSCTSMRWPLLIHYLNENKSRKLVLFGICVSGA